MSGSEVTGVGRVGVGPVVGLRLSHEARVDLERVPEVLGDAASTWLGEELPAEVAGVRRFLCDLELHAGGSGPTIFRKAAIVSIAEADRGADGWVVPIEWQAASMSPLFPVFSGRIVIGPEVLELDGRYAPPGGRLGYMLDVSLLGMAARQTGRWFLSRMADALV